MNEQRTLIMGNNDNSLNEELQTAETSETTVNNPFSEDCISKEEVEEITEECDNTIEKMQSEIDKLNNQYLRLAADFDNYRKRQMQEREALLKYGAEDTLKKLIETLDTIDRAVASTEKLEDVKAVKDSYNIVFKQLFDALNKIGLEVIETKDATFDPNLHEAVMQTPTSEYPEHTIIAELQKGYKLGDRVLRPALVNVAVSE